MQNIREYAIHIDLMADVKITRRQAGKIQNLPSSKRHQIQCKTKYTCHMLEVEDVNFHHDSAVLLPDYGSFKPQEDTTEEQDRITGLAVLYACYRHVREHPEQAALVVGHTDRSGRKSYNQTLSELRAKNVRHALQGNRRGWVDIVLQKSKVEDYQQILLWLTHSVGWNCDPGDKTKTHDSQTKQAVESFQRQYNDGFSASIGVDGLVGEETWGAFFDAYMHELQHALGTDEEGVQEAQDSVQFTDCASIGCGERHPITPNQKENYKTPIDRRVEIRFFDPGEEPPIEKDCTNPERTCPELYKDGIYEVTPIPTEPLPSPSGEAVHVMLRLAFKDPDPSVANHMLPEGFPVTVAYADGAKEVKHVGTDGMLEFFAPREKKAFTFQFQFSSAHYIASPSASGEPDELIAESQVADRVERNFRVFKLPKDWSLATSDWDMTGAATYNTTTHQFEQLDDTSITKIGSAATPIKMQLDPHWQYIKLLYFDRWVKQTLSIPPVMVEGFRQTPAAGQPDTRSNWTTYPESCQCVPWIVQDPPKPDDDVLLQFRTEADTYIETTGTSSNYTRRFVTKRSRSASGSNQDPGLTSGASIKRDFDEPNAKRLAYYDLPPVWKSRTYFTRLSGGTGAPAAKSGQFEDLAGEATTNEQPLLFSLDDIVLTDPNLDPINWTPNNQPQNRVAIFCNTFAKSGPSSANLSNIGLYKPDTGNNQAYFTQRPSEETDRNYIADYPDWTRLVIRQGNMFDVFDQRTPDRPNEVVGARAGVRYLDVFASSDTFVPPGTDRPDLPAATRHPFITIHPFYEQQHDEWWKPSTSTTRGIGRFDLVLLRCCDVDSGNNTEIGQCLSYFRFFFNSHATFESNPVKMSANQERAWGNTAISNLLDRWNGFDTYGDPVSIRPTGKTPKLNVKNLWFAQDLPRKLSHYELGVFQNVRAYMSAPRGEGALDNQDNTADSSGWFTFAHEVGHAASLGDEYVEPTTPINKLRNLKSGRVTRLSGFGSFSPGAPFVKDEEAMMVSNKEIRSRFFWHIAEWLRHLWGQGVDFEVEHGPYTFRLPHHSSAPHKNHVNFPLREARDQERGDHGKYDVFFYPLGEEAFSDDVLPKSVLRPAAARFDGIVVVIVKMEFDFDINTSSWLLSVHNWLASVHSEIDSQYNKKFYVEGTLNGQTYDRCLLHFSPRYFAYDDGIFSNKYYSKEAPEDNDEHIIIDVPDKGTPQWASGLFASDYKLNFSYSQSAATFAKFFADMLDVPNNAQANDYAPITQTVIPNATVQTI